MYPMDEIQKYVSPYRVISHAYIQEGLTQENGKPFPLSNVTALNKTNRVISRKMQFIFRTPLMLYMNHEVPP